MLTKYLNQFPTTNIYVNKVRHKARPQHKLYVTAVTDIDKAR